MNGWGILVGTATLAFIMFIYGCIYKYIRMLSNKSKGKYGERKIQEILLSLPDEYYVFNDIILDEDGFYSQIDHVVISPYGIFVIETKNLTGWIYGNEKSEEWIQNIYGNKYYFRNPIKQNNAHVLAIKSLYGLSSNQIIPIVVFLDGAKLFVTTKSNVIGIHEMYDCIRSYNSIRINNDRIESMAKKLVYSSFETTETRKLQRGYSRAKAKQYYTSIKKQQCPKCGGNLVQRNGKYGTFYGCSNYPNCVFTVQK